jgi:hypothetical protein
MENGEKSHYPSYSDPFSGIAIASAGSALPGEQNIPAWWMRRQNLNQNESARGPSSNF